MFVFLLLGTYFYVNGKYVNDKILLDEQNNNIENEFF